MTPPRKSRRLKQVPTMKAGTKRPATGRVACVMPKKMLRSQDQELSVTMATDKQGWYIVQCCRPRKGSTIIAAGEVQMEIFKQITAY